MKTLLSAAASAAILTGFAAAAPVVIDFEDQAAGTTITGQYAGITFSGTGFGAMVFDTANVTGGDADLGAPFTSLDGETLDPGNVLILSEDGDASDPDDAAGGGTIEVAFDAAVTLNGITILDIDEGERFAASLFDDNDVLLFGLFLSPVPGDNGFVRFSDLGITEVARIVFAFSGSGAIDEIVFDEVSEVPLPAAGFLFAGGLAAFGAARRRAA